MYISTISTCTCWIWKKKLYSVKLHLKTHVNLHLLLIINASRFFFYKSYYSNLELHVCYTQASLYIYVGTCKCTNMCSCMCMYIHIHVHVLHYGIPLVLLFINNNLVIHIIVFLIIM